MNTLQDPDVSFVCYLQTPVLFLVLVSVLSNDCSKFPVRDKASNHCTTLFFPFFDSKPCLTYSSLLECAALFFSTMYLVVTRLLTQHVLQHHVALELKILATASGSCIILCGAWFQRKLLFLLLCPGRVN